MSKAKKNIMVADHMLSVTYPLIKDTKLLIAILDNIFLALTNSVGALLHHERLFKRIPPFHETFDSKFNIFRLRCIDKFNIDKAYIPFILDIKDIIVQHNKSPVEFAKGDKFVICSESYKMKSISLKDIKEYLIKTKNFNNKIDEILSKNDGLFN